MCQYINIVLPTEVKIDKIEPLFVKHGLGYRPFKNSFIQRQLIKGGHLVNTTSKQCDCNSVISSVSYPSSRDIMPHDIEKLKLKGWSETKIKNWIQNKTKTNLLVKERDTERAQWIKFLQEIILDIKVTNVSIYIHWYSGVMEAEEITFKAKERVSVYEITGDKLDRLNYDILYEFAQ